MLKHRSLVMLFSDLLGEPDPILKALHRLRFAGHDLIIFHILDEAEALFPFEGMLELEDNETHETLEVDADGDQGRLPGRGRTSFARLPEGVRSRPHRLRSAAHGDAVRQGPDELSAQPDKPRA